MSQRQYVGARYVPKFADPIEWDNNRSYEALTVVTHNGGSYTSKKPVPVGVNITDENYWVLTFNYNAQVEAYRKMVESETDVRKKRILVIGDSYNDQSRGQYATNGVTVWGIQAMNILGVENYTNIGLSGAGWIHANDIGKKFIDGLIEASPSANYTDIIVGGGLNDVIHYSSPQNPMGAIAEFITLAKMKYPGVKVHIGVLGYTLSENQVYEYSYVNTIRNNETGLDFSYITNIEYAIRGKKWLLDDKLHPTQAASTRIASGIVQYMKGSTPNFTDSFSYTTDGGVTDTGTTSKTLLPVFVEINNGELVIKTSENPLNLSTPLVYNTTSRSMTFSLGTIVGYDFIGKSTITGLRCVCGSGITGYAEVTKDSDGLTVYNGPVYGTVRFEPVSTFVSGKVDKTEMICTLSLVRCDNGNIITEATIPKDGLRFPFMTGSSNSLTV